MPLSKLVHLRNMQFSNCSKVTNESSLDLQITGVYSASLVIYVHAFLILYIFLAILADLENLSQATEA